MSTIADDLVRSGMEAAQEAIKQYAAENLPRFCMEAARSIELCGKAVLARISPVLIAEPKNVESQLHLARHAGTRSRPRRAIRTISCRDVIDRLALVIPAIRPQDIMPIVDARDGSTHYLVDEHGALEALVVPYLAAFSLILTELGISDSLAFGDDAELVRRLQTEHAKKVDRVVAAKIARAKRVFVERFEDFSPAVRDQVIAEIERSYSLEKYDEQLVTCPACGKEAVVSGWHEFVGWEADRRGDSWPEVVMWAEEFECGVCRLKLHSLPELKAAGLDTGYEIEDADPDDFAEEDDTPYE